MPRLLAHRFQLRCKSNQERLLMRFAGGLRWLWNQALAEQKRRHAAGEKFAGYAEMCKWLTGWRHGKSPSGEPLLSAWLAEGPIHPQQQTLKRLEAAYKRFFSKTGGFPSFKRRGEEPGLRYPDAKQFELDLANGRLKLPKLGWVRMRQSRAVDGVLKNVSVTREGDRWFVSLQVELPDVVPAADLKPTLALDMGLTVFAASSAGDMIAPLKALAGKQRHLKRCQRNVSRKKKGSANRKKAVKCLAKAHRDVANMRSDWSHQETTKLADQHAVIALEDLEIKNMSASAKGTVAAPGKNVKAKAALNRGILDAAWGQFRQQLEYKLSARGGRLMLVPPAYSSQTCSVCQHVDKANRQTQAQFKCMACGHTDNADVNAAKVLLQRAMMQHEDQLAAGHAVGPERANACGGDVSRGLAARPTNAAPMKQEPTEGLVLAFMPRPTQ